MPVIRGSDSCARTAPVSLGVRYCIVRNLRMVNESPLFAQARLAIEDRPLRSPHEQRDHGKQRGGQEKPDQCHGDIEHTLGTSSEYDLW